MNVRNNIKNIFVVLLVLLVVLPLGYMLLVLGMWFKDSVSEKDGIYLQHPYLTATMKPNLDINNNNYPILLSDGTLGTVGKHHFKTNSMGFRDSEFNVHKSKLRVCVLGGSVLLGGSDLNTTITALVEKKLNKHNNVEVLNFGSAGWWSRQELFIYGTKVTNFKCDIVWIHDGRNDAWTGVMPGYKPNYDSWDSYRMDILSKVRNQDRLEKYFYPYVKIRNKLFPLSSEHKLDCIAYYQNSANNGCAGVYKFRPEQVEVYRTNLRSLAALVKNDNAKLIISTQPSLLYGKNKMHKVEIEIVSRLSLDFQMVMNEYRKEIVGVAKNISEEYGACYVDLTKRFYDDSQYIYYDDVHHNEVGNELIAATMSEIISRFINSNACINKM